jgi:hypothetical protein
MDFTRAYIVGVDRSSEYFGDRTAQYRTVDTISVEGYIDSRAANSDFKGVRQTLSSITSFVNQADNTNVCEAITINGSGFGTGRLVNINFPASNSVDENQITIGKYIAQVEIYNSGNIRDTFNSSARTLTTVSASDTTEVFTKANHNLLNGMEVEITSMTGSGPSLNTTYHVGNVTASTFKLYEDSRRTALVDITSDPFVANLSAYYMVPFPEYLESLTEDFSISLGEDNVYNLTQSLDITYISGVEPGGTVIDPISTAKSLAINLFDQTPSQFSLIINPDGQHQAQTSRKYFTENYNLIDGSANFQKTFSVLPSGKFEGGTYPYSIQVSNSFSFDEGGVVKVSEDGEIQPRTPEFLQEAKEALDTELASSFDRCNQIYQSYKNYLGTNSSSLFSQAVTKSKTINNSAGTASYSVEYTDDLKVQNLTTLQSRSLNIEESDSIHTVTENGTVTSINSKSTSFDPYSLIPDRSTVKARCQDLYDEEMPTPMPTAIRNLKNLNNKFTIPAYGKQISYTYAFTNDMSVFDTGTFSKKTIKHSDKIGIPNQSAVTIPNFTSQVLHTTNQTSLGTRSSSIEGQLRRNRFFNNLTEIQGYRFAGNDVTDAIQDSKLQVLMDAYMVYADNNQIRSLDKGSIYITSCKFSYGSDNTFSMSADCTFTMQRVELGEYNLAFSP